MNFVSSNGRRRILLQRLDGVNRNVWAIEVKNAQFGELESQKNMRSSPCPQFSWHHDGCFETSVVNGQRTCYLSLLVCFLNNRKPVVLDVLEQSLCQILK